MPKFIVNISRVSYSFRETEIEAENEEEAEKKAIDEAGDYEYSEKEAEYFVNGISKSE